MLCFLFALFVGFFGVRKEARSWVGGKEFWGCEFKRREKGLLHRAFCFCFFLFFFCFWGCGRKSLLFLFFAFVSPSPESSSTSPSLLFVIILLSLCQQLSTAAAITLLLPVIPEPKFPVVVVLGGLVSRYCLLLLRLDQIVFLFSLRLLFFVRFESSSDSSDWKLFVCLERERERGVERISPGKTSSIR